MTETQNPDAAAVDRRNGLSWPQVLLIVAAAVLLTAGATYFFLTSYLFVDRFEPVQLKPGESQVLDAKLRRIGYQPDAPQAPGGALEPQPYSESDADREVSFSERELNALLANNTDLAERLAIDLSRDLMSLRLLVPMDPDFPMLGGKTLRFNAGLELAYRGERPVVILKGASLMGVPIPNAWLGNLKNVDLVGEFSAEQGFWKAFADGVADIRVEQGRMKVRLKE